MMDYFDTAFVLVMILLPAAFTLFVRRKEAAAGARTPDGEQRLAAMQRRLWLWTAVAAFVYVALLMNDMHAPGYPLWIAFFPLWFFLALPVLRAKDPGWAGVPRTTVRTATLVRRDVLPERLQRAWMLLAGIWVVLLVAGAAGLLVAAPGASMWWLLAFPVMGGAQLAFFHWGSKRSLVEPEPSATRETTEIRAARESLRSLKLYGWLGLAGVCVVVFSAPALILIWFGESALTAAIAVGAGGGALAGIGGGVFGTIADLRRAKLNRLCIEGAPSPR
jgi:hypothetical protein